ncbi:MAG: hypothetical protein O3A00_04285 [Planctomycetota bacterium]|nr:hypothetical protein [Planctomycetota bacterium]
MIEFNCPYCTATVRVPPSAAGKRGTCPKCETKIIVPHVEPPRPAEPTTRPVQSPTEQTVEPIAPGGPPPLPPQIPDAAPPPLFPGPRSDSSGGALDFDSQPTPPSKSIARRYSKRRKRQSVNFVVPLVFGGILVGVVMWFFMKTSVKLEGDLTATVVAEDPTFQESISRSQIKLADDKVDFVFESLNKTPVSIPSTRMNVFFSASRNDLKVEIRAGTGTRFYVVNVQKDKVLSEWVAENAETLNGPRFDQIERNAADFISEMEKARREDENGKPGDLLGYRNRLGLAALTKALGFHVSAKLQSQLYPCVYQSEEGNLYFLLPESISSFELVGRQLADGSNLFPGTYTVKVQAGPAKKSAATKSDDPKE